MDVPWCLPNSQQRHKDNLSMWIQTQSISALPPLCSIWSSPMEAPMWFLCPFYSSASSGQWRSSAASITPLRSALLKFSMQTQWMTTFSFTGFESAVLHSKGKTPCPLLPLRIVGGLCANLDVCISVEDSLTAFVKLSIQLWEMVIWEIFLTLYEKYGWGSSHLSCWHWIWMWGPSNNLSFKVREISHRNISLQLLWHMQE